MLLLIDNVPGHPRALMEMDSGMNIVYMPGNTTSILQSMDGSRSIFDFKVL